MKSFHGNAALFCFALFSVSRGHIDPLPTEWRHSSQLGEHFFSIAEVIGFEYRGSHLKSRGLKKAVNLKTVPGTSQRFDGELYHFVSLVESLQN